MNHMLRKTACVLLSIVLVSAAACFPSAAEGSGVTAEDKLSPGLKEMLSTMEGGDQTEVSVWISDIDRQTVKEQTAAVMEDAASENEISRCALSLLDESGDNAEQSLSRLARAEAPALFSFAQNKMQALPAQETALDVSSDDSQFFVEAERAVSSALYQEKNASVIQSLFPGQKQGLFRSAKQEQPEILYSCKYAPNIMLRLTKDEIYSIIESEDVLEVYPYAPAQEPVEEAGFEAASPDASTLSYENLSTVWQDVTGISYLRDTCGKDGTGIKIGMLENSAPDFSNTQGVNCFRHMIDEENPENNKIINVFDLGYKDSHSTYGASLIVGKLGAYKGVVPNAELYCAGTWSVSGYKDKEGIETLISEGVNVINCSHYFSDSTAVSSNNQYGDIAKWLDHVAVDHHVSLVISSGNLGSLGIPSGNMSLNAIVVGNLDTKNTLDLSDDTLRMVYDKDGKEVGGYCSSYSNNTMLPFKPDLIAPGQYTACPYSPSGGGGTSSAAPVVTGAVAQLMQADPYLKTRPDLVKALLLCGTTHMAQQSSQNNDVPAMDRKLGSGMLNVYNSYTALSSSSYPKYYTGKYTYGENTQLHKTVLISKPCDTVRIALTWNKTHSFNSISTHLSPNLSMAPMTRLKLTVVTPDQKTYNSISMTGNVQLISLPSPKMGTYHIYVDRINEFWHSTDFSIAVLNGDVMS